MKVPEIAWSKEEDRWKVTVTGKLSGLAAKATIARARRHIDDQGLKNRLLRGKSFYFGTRTSLWEFEPKP